jgi:hypothetical protein
MKRRALIATLFATAAIGIGGFGLAAVPAHAMRANNCDPTWLDARDFWLGQGAYYVLWRDYPSAQECFAEADRMLDMYRLSC